MTESAVKPYIILYTRQAVGKLDTDPVSECFILHIIRMLPRIYNPEDICVFEDVLSMI